MVDVAMLGMGKMEGPPSLGLQVGGHVPSQDTSGVILLSLVSLGDKVLLSFRPTMPGTF